MPDKTLRAALVAAGILAAGSSAALLASTPGATAQAPTREASTPVLLSRPDYRAIVRAAGPAVVGVMVEGEREPFRGQGSGFIVSEDGLVLTNAHVVRDARQVVVRLADRREFSARVIGADPVTDVAVLRVAARGLPTVRLGDPRGLEVGDPVLAIGAPYGLEHSATQGIVSAKGRSLPGDAVVPFIQTDAAVNPGNSGGPLFDGSGAVVGINAQIFSRSGGFQGLSFAIPIDVALRVKDQILATGKAQHGRLGVAAQDLDQTLARSFGLSAPSGALISQVLPGSAAAAAGLKPGDVIIAVGGQPVQRSGNLSSLIGLANPGERVMLTVWRDRATRELPVTLGSAPPAPSASAPAPAADGARVGLALREPDAAERARLGLPQGLLIEQVSGVAARAGIRPGDALLLVEGQPVQSVAQARRLIQGAADGVAVLIQRDDGRFFVGLKPAARMG
jgi:serine protease Do